MVNRTACVTVATLILLTIGFGLLLPADAKMVPLRSGKVVSSEDAKTYTFIEAVDAEGKTFWLLTAVCVVGQGGTVDVLAGTHYDEVKSEVLGKELKGLSGHGLPAGCVTLN